MCGRYASARKRIELLEEFGVQSDQTGGELRPDYNVAPTKQVYAVLTRHEADAGAGPAAGAGELAELPPPVRQLRTVRWGLVPSWAKDPKIGSRMINARAETVASKPAYRRAFARRRCLLPADGYYEWYRPGEDAKAAKQPYFMHRADGGPLAFAGLYEFWRDKTRPEDDPESWLITTTIITTSAPDELGRIHDRMPMVIQPDEWEQWLDPDLQDAAEVAHLLTPAGSHGLVTRRVSTAVNSVRHNGPELIEEISGDEAGPPADAVPLDSARPSRSRPAGEPPARPGEPDAGAGTPDGRPSALF
jgi:putative SOS response-associated peptidase YedK